jgi:hypothetical protein
MLKDFNNIDKLAQETFENFEVDFNPEDWNRMEAKLDKKEHLMPFIWLFKGVEASVLLLIIFTVFNFWYGNNQNSNIAVSDNNNSEKITATSENKVLDFNTHLSGQNEKYEQEITTAKETALLNLNVKGANKTGNNNNRISEFGNNSASKNVSSTAKISKDNNLSNTVSINSTKNNAILNTSEIPMLSVVSQDIVPNLSNLLIQPVKIDKNSLNDGPGDGVEEGESFSLKTNFKFPKLYRRQLRAVLFGGADINLANDLGGNNLGMTIGVLFENEISQRFAIRTGILTSRKTFENSFTKIIDRTATEAVIYESKVDQKSTLTVLSLPVYLNTIIHRDEKWKMSISVGFAAAFLSNRFVSGKQRTSVYQSAGAVTAITELNGNTFEKGLLQGGAAKNNIYMSAGLGFDVERQLGDRVTLFLQPMFQYAINPVGLDKTRLNQFSLNVGIKGVLR